MSSRGQADPSVVVVGGAVVTTTLGDVDGPSGGGVSGGKVVVDTGNVAGALVEAGAVVSAVPGATTVVGAAVDSTVDDAVGVTDTRA